MSDLVSISETTDLNAEQVQALIDVALNQERRRQWLTRKFSPSDITGNQTWGGTRTPTVAYTNRGGQIRMGPPNGANKLIEVSELIVPIVNAANGSYQSSVPMRMRCFVNAITFGTTPAGEAFQGIEFGTMATAPPWQSTYTGTSGSVVQLRYNFTSSRWETMYWDGNTSLAPQIDACLINPAFDPDAHQRMIELRWNPHPTESTLNNFQAYIDGVLAQNITGGRLANVGLLDNLAGIFATTGSGSPTTLQDAYFNYSEVSCDIDAMGWTYPDEPSWA